MPEIIRMASRQPTLGVAQAVVGGYVELLELPDGTQILVDEDGITKDKPLNTDATRLLVGTRFDGQRILGDALLLSGKACWRD
jgi:Domain of unknown function (DUF3846)